MKIDSWGCFVREKYPEGEKANLGDSCGDTCRAYVLGFSNPHLENGVYSTFRDYQNDGYLRHPKLMNVKGWDSRDFTNDMLVPYAMATYLWSTNFFRMMSRDNGLFIKGTWKLLQPAAWALLNEKWWLLNKLNVFQGWLLGLPFRWSDDEHEGWGFRSSKGKVQDYLNLVAIFVFLKRIGQPATRPRLIDECLAAVKLYRTGPADFEPNSEWEFEIYRNALSTWGES